MLPILALAVALAAPVPKVAPPFPLRTDPLPKEFDFDKLADAAMPRSQKGTVSVLAWYTIESDRPSAVTRVLILKAFDDPDEKGNKFALCYLWWDDERGDWCYRFVFPTQPAPGQKVEWASDAFYQGCQSYAALPTDKELAAFLKDTDWTPWLGAAVVDTSGGKRTITTKLAAGGFGRVAWKKHFDRDPPVELFPELKVKKEAK